MPGVGWLLQHIFFFQAEDGIRDVAVTGVQTCALPISHGYRTNLWTTARIAEVIERKFRVRYHRDHVGRLMHSLKWSPQKPERRALERKDAEIERWKKEEWPRVKKTLRGWAPTSYLPTNRAFS